MPYLGDYVGHLLSEMTMARMQADLEAVRVAELYASHPLLRGMPVPHFRLPEMDLDIPVVINHVEEPRPDESPRGGTPITEMRKTFEQVLANQFLEAGIKMTPAYKTRLSSLLDARTLVLSQPKETAVDVNRIADDFASESVRTLKDIKHPSGPLEPALMQKLEVGLKESARLELLKLRKPPPRLNVLVTTQEIREAGPDAVVTRIRMKLTEQAVEWTTIESEGQPQDRLVPE